MSEGIVTTPEKFGKPWTEVKAILLVAFQGISAIAAFLFFLGYEYLGTFLSRFRIPVSALDLAFSQVLLYGFWKPSANVACCRDGSFSCSTRRGTRFGPQLSGDEVCHSKEIRGVT